MANLLKGDVDIPHVGKFPKIAIVGGVGGVIALIIWENHKNAAAAATTGTGVADTGDATDDGSGYYGGGDSYATGLQTSASYPWDGTYDDTSDPYSMDSSTGQTYGTEGYSGSVSAYGTTSTGPPFSTNSQWSQYVLNYFADSDNLQAMTDAIGLYLAGSTVTSAQQGLINDATAIGEVPPVTGPNGYPPSIRTAGSTAGGTGTKAGSPVAYTSGGHVVSVNNNDAVIAWTGHNAVKYTTVIHGPGPINGHTGSTTAQQGTFSGLQAGHNYSVTVTPYDAQGHAGTTGTIDIKTTK